jgi:hypothetical protein
MWVTLLWRAFATALSIALTAVPAGTPARARFSLTVSPSRLVVPADQITRPRQLVLTNRGRSPLDVVARMATITAGPDGRLVLQLTAATPAVQWMTVVPDHFRLAAGRSQRVRLAITVPAGADPGERELVAIFSVPAPKGAGIGVSGAVGATVYVTAPGPVVDSVEISGLRAPGFAVGGPLVISATVRNAGTVHRDLVGGDRLQLRAAGATLPFADFTVLRGSSRRVGLRWSDPPLWCICRLSVAVNNPGGASQMTATVVILPLPLMGAGAAGGVALGGAGWLAWRRARRRVIASDRA